MKHSMQYQLVSFTGSINIYQEQRNTIELRYTNDIKDTKALSKAGLAQEIFLTL